jgi:hypothetical protein
MAKTTRKPHILWTKMLGIPIDVSILDTTQLSKRTISKKKWVSKRAISKKKMGKRMENIGYNN